MLLLSVLGLTAFLLSVYSNLSTFELYLMNFMEFPCSIYFIWSWYIRRIRQNLTSHCASIIYTYFIRPVVEQGDCCGIGNSTSLEKLQRRAARVVTKITESDRALGRVK